VRQRHGALQLLGHLQLDVDTDVVREAVAKQAGLLPRSQIAGVSQPSLEGLDAVIDGVAERDVREIF
jgi:hypothetical protein